MKKIFLSLMGLAFYTLSIGQLQVSKTNPDEVFLPLPKNAYELKVVKQSKVKGVPSKVEIILKKDHTPFTAKELLQMKGMKLEVILPTSKTAHFPNGTTSQMLLVGNGNLHGNGTATLAADIVDFDRKKDLVEVRWQIPVLKEGCCSLALLGTAVGCSGQGLTNAQYEACICSGISSMPFPGSSCCGGGVMSKVWGFSFGCP